MRRFSLLLLTAFAAPAAAQPPAGAQPPAAPQPPRSATQSPAGTPPPAITTPAPMLNPGAIAGRIQVCDCARGEHRVRLEGGRRYAIGASSRTFDPVLRLLRPGSEQVLAEDDDSGGGVSPRVTFTAPATGDYVVRVSSALPGGAGDYTLNVIPAAPMPPLLVRPSRVQPSQWQEFDGNLASGSVENGRPYQDYELRLAAGQSAMIHVRGQQDLDTSLQIFSIAGRGSTPIVENDDGGGGNDPFVFFAPAQPGTYVVRVIGFDEQARGTYRLRIGR